MKILQCLSQVYKVQINAASWLNWKDLVSIIDTNLELPVGEKNAFPSIIILGNVLFKDKVEHTI